MATWPHQLLFWFRALVRRRSLERELDREIRLHIQLEMEKNQRSGMSIEDAHRIAHTAFGGIERQREAVRDEFGTRWLGDFASDVRYAIRALRKRPGFVVVVAGTLALGIGATSTIFTVVDSVLIRPLPYQAPDRIVSISERQGERDQRVVRSPDILAWSRDAHQLAAIAAYSNRPLVLTGAGDAAQVNGTRTSGQYFRVLGVSPLIGRVLREDDAAAGAPRVAVLSRHLWEARFGADSSIVGRTVTLDGDGYVVVGVVAGDGALLRTTDCWVPLAMTTQPGSGVLYYYGVLARLRPGASVQGLQSELNSLLARDDAARPAGQRGTVTVVKTLHDRLFGSMRSALVVLFMSVLVLLLIACANVANLMLVRGTARRRELAVRSALGATRGRLIRLLLIESLVLGAAGAALGSLLPVALVGVFVRLSPAALSRAGTIHVDGSILVFTLAVGLGTGLLFGIMPAWTNTSRDGAIVGTSALADAGRAQRRFRRALVVAELALALVLMTAAGLLTHTLVNILDTDRGFVADRLAAVSFILPSTRFPDEGARDRYFLAVQRRIAAVSGVESTALSDVAPPDGMSMSMLVPVPGGDSVETAIDYVSRNFPAVVGLVRTAARVFDSSDVRGVAVAVVFNATAARALYPHSGAVGQSFQLRGGFAPATVIGVVKDMPSPGSTLPPKPRVYFAREQGGGDVGVLLARARGDRAQVEAAIRREVALVDPLQPVSSFEWIDDTMAQEIAPQRLNSLLLGVVASVALLLGAVGLYGVMTFTVTRRTRELGIRMALGADRTGIRALVLQQGLGMIVPGCLIGVMLSLLVSRGLHGLLYGVGQLDPVTFVGAPLVLAAVGLLATYLPARRATAVDPAIALRNE